MECLTVSLYALEKFGGFLFVFTAGVCTVDVGSAIPSGVLKGALLGALRCVSLGILGVVTQRKHIINALCQPR